MAEFVVAEINNVEVPIQIGLKRPKFKDFNAFEQWYAAELAYATSLKERLEAGENLPHSIEQDMINWSKKHLNDLKKNAKLNTEKILLFLDMKIKIALKKDDYNTKQCIGLLQQLKRLRFTPLMLKKNPETIKTVERITRFKGKSLDLKEVRKINKYGHRILKKMSAMFNTVGQKSFLKVFKQKENKFYQRNLDLNITSTNMMVEEH